MRSRRARRVVLASSIVLALLLVPTTYHAIVHLRHDLRAAEATRRLDERVAQHRARFGGPDAYRRPVLRGEPIEGNAGEALLRAAAPLRGIDVPHEVREDLARGTPPPEWLRALAANHRDVLDEVRAATQRAWSFVDAYEEGFEGTCEAIGNASLLLVVRAWDEAPAACLRLAADAIRVQHDDFGGCFGSARVRQATPIAMRCAVRADRADVLEAARELELLARHSPPDAIWHELEWLRRIEAAEEEFRRKVWLPMTRDELHHLLRQGEILDAWERRFASAVLGREPEYPDCPTGWGLALCDVMAELRAAALLMRVLASTDPADGFPRASPSLLTTSDIANDPFSPRPRRLGWGVSEDAREASIYSVGWNGRDDGGLPGSDDVRAVARLPSP